MSSGVPIQYDSSFLILSSDGQQEASNAAEALSALGTKHEVSIIEGGFERWKESSSSGLKTKRLRKGSEREAQYLHLTLDTMDTIDEGDALLIQSPAKTTHHLLTSQQNASLIFRPKLLDTIDSIGNGKYGLQDLRQDVLSGITVGVIALSLSMALGIASESTPAIGLTTAVVAGFLISATGGSKVAIGGPTAAFIPILIGISHQYGPEKLVICTILAGGMLILMGLTGLGSAVKLVPRPVTTGFTAGIATFILSTQMKDALGLGIVGRLPEGASIPSPFLEKIIFLGQNLEYAHIPSLALAISGVILIKAYPASWAKVVPPQIVAVVVGSLALGVSSASFGESFGIETIGSHFGNDAIPRSLPSPHFPEGIIEVFSHPDELSALLKPSFTIALLAAIESLLCAKVSDGFIGDRHRPNTELIAQGIANIASGAFGGLPATGALARTAANVRAGGASPISGVVHAITVLLFILVAAPAAAFIPLPTLAAVLIVVGLNMGEWKNFTLLAGWPKRDSQVFLVAFTLTLFMDVSVAVEVGMFAALVMFYSSVTSSTYVRAVTEGEPLIDPNFLTSRSLVLVPKSGLGEGFRVVPMKEEIEAIKTLSELNVASMSSFDGDLEDQGSGSSGSSGEDGRKTSFDLQVPPRTAYLEVTGSLLFGALDLFEEALEGAAEHTPPTSSLRCIILDLSHVSVVDASGLEVLEEQLERLRKQKIQLVLTGLSRQPLKMLSRSGFLDHLDRRNVVRTLEEAVSKASGLVGIE